LSLPSGHEKGARWIEKQIAALRLRSTPAGKFIKGAPSGVHVVPPPGQALWAVAGKADARHDPVRYRPVGVGRPGRETARVAFTLSKALDDEEQT
jgi:hypothetical protein